MEQKIFVTRSSMPELEEYIDEIRSLWDTRWLTNMGEKHRLLQERLQQYLGVERVELLTNGHMALELSLQALGLKGEVITTPFTFASTTHAIVRSGLEPVFCDINEENYTIDASKIEELITDKTCAILPVHVYGNVCDTEAIDRIAKKHHLKVLYDAAHAFGVRCADGRGIGSFGDVSCFSFHATKVFHTIEGGGVCYRDEEFGRKLYHLKNFGICAETEVNAVGANAKMNEFQAAMGLCNLRHIEEEIGKRGSLVGYYREYLQGCRGIRLPKRQEGMIPNNAYFPVIFEEEETGVTRDEIYNVLRENEIFARKYFYPLVPSFKCYENRFREAKVPVAQNIAQSVLTLPLYADLKREDVDRICSLIRKRLQRL